MLYVPNILRSLDNPRDAHLNKISSLCNWAKKMVAYTFVSRFSAIECLNLVMTIITKFLHRKVTLEIPHSVHPERDWPVSNHSFSQRLVDRWPKYLVIYFITNSQVKKLNYYKKFTKSSKVYILLNPKVLSPLILRISANRE